MGPGGELLPTLWQGGEEPTKANTIPDEGHRGCLKQKSAASGREKQRSRGWCHFPGGSDVPAQRQEAGRAIPARGCRACQINRVEPAGQAAAGDKTRKLTRHPE